MNHSPITIHHAVGLGLYVSYSSTRNRRLALLYCLPWLLFLSIIVDIEWEISKLAVSVNFSNGVTLPVVFHFDGWSAKAVIVFVVVGGIVRASSVMASWGFAVVSLEAVLNCIVKCGKSLRPCVVSMTTLLFLIKSNSIIGPSNFFITTRCSAKTVSPVSNLSVAVANGFFIWPLATCI